MKTSTNPIIESRLHDLGGLKIRRVLPYSRAGQTRRHVGPFVFLDHMGPIETTTPMFVPEHPHIGLATATALFEGEILHRDSLGSEQVIRPGELNLMTAGEWITHLEQGLTRSVHGLQFWIALPKTHEIMKPQFRHLDHTSVPKWERDRLSIQLLMGSLEARQSKAEFPSRSLFATIRSDRSNESSHSFVDFSFVDFSIAEKELGLYVAEGECEIRIEAETIDQQETINLQMGQLLLLESPVDVKKFAVRLRPSTSLAVFGGDPLDGERVMKWNYVASRKELIDRAEAKWADMTSNDESSSAKN